MAIVKTISKWDFTNEFQAIRPDNFTSIGLDILFDYLEDLEGDIELDVIALCCEYEQASTEDVVEMFPEHFDGVDLVDVSVYDAVQTLEKETFVVGYDRYSDVIVFQSF